jgi:hypothetical protein
LEDAGGAIVGEALAKLDDGDQEGALGEGLSHLAEGKQFLGGRLHTANAIFLDNDGSRVGARAVNTRLLEGDVRASDVGVVERSAVDVGVVVSNLLVVLKGLGAVVRLVASDTSMP